MLRNVTRAEAPLTKIQLIARDDFSRCNERTRHRCSDLLLAPLLYPPNYDTNVRRSLQQSYLPLGIVKLLDKVTFFCSGCIYHIGSLPNYASNYEQVTSRRRKSIVTVLRSSHLRHDITIGVLRLS